MDTLINALSSFFMPVKYVFVVLAQLVMTVLCVFLAPKLVKTFFEGGNVLGTMAMGAMTTAASAALGAGRFGVAAGGGLIKGGMAAAKATSASQSRAAAGSSASAAAARAPSSATGTQSPASAAAGHGTSASESAAPAPAHASGAAASSMPDMSLRDQGDSGQTMEQKIAQRNALNAEAKSGAKANRNAEGWGTVSGGIGPRGSSQQKAGRKPIRGAAPPPSGHRGAQSAARPRAQAQATTLSHSVGSNSGSAKPGVGANVSRSPNVSATPQSPLQTAVGRAMASPQPAAAARNVSQGTRQFFDNLGARGRKLAAGPAGIIVAETAKGAARGLVGAGQAAMAGMMSGGDLGGFSKVVAAQKVWDWKKKQQSRGYEVAAERQTLRPSEQARL